MRRVDYIAVAKGIRDSGAGKNQRRMVVDSIVKFLIKLHPTMDVAAFRAMADAEQDYRDSIVGHRIDKLEDDVLS